MSGGGRRPASRPGEYEFEAQHGLPEALPDGEEILWQGAPRWQSLALRVFLVRGVAIYFGLVLVWRLASGILDGSTAMDLAVSVVWVVMPALAAIGILSLCGWLNARATVYTITNRRVVIRLGVAFELSVNLPFAMIQSADFNVHPDGTGEIALTLNGVEDLGYAMLWPHVRPWHFAEKLQPMLRCVPDAVRVADTLGEALSAAVSARQSVADPSLAQAPFSSRETHVPERRRHFEPDAMMAR